MSKSELPQQMQDAINSAFKPFTQMAKPKSSQDLTAKTDSKKVTALKFEDPEKCQYCGKTMEQTKVGDLPVRVCWSDRNVTPLFTGDAELPDLTAGGKSA